MATGPVSKTHGRKPAVRANFDRLPKYWFLDEMIRLDVYRRMDRMIADGYSQAAIARSIGVSDRAVSRHSVRRGRIPDLARDTGRKLTDDQIRQIRQRLDEGAISRDLAEEFGVSPTAICDIKLGRSWKDVY